MQFALPSFTTFYRRQQGLLLPLLEREIEIEKDKITVKRHRGKHRTGHQACWCYHYQYWQM